MKVSTITRVTATGDVTTRTAFLRSVILTAGADAATLVIREGGVSGTIKATIKAAADSTASVPSFADGQCTGGIHATLTGTGPQATFTYA